MLDCQKAGFPENETALLAPLAGQEFPLASPKGGEDGKEIFEE